MWHKIKKTNKQEFAKVLLTKSFWWEIHESFLPSINICTIRYTSVQWLKVNSSPLREFSWIHFYLWYLWITGWASVIHTHTLITKTINGVYYKEKGSKQAGNCLLINIKSTDGKFSQVFLCQTFTIHSIVIREFPAIMYYDMRRRLDLYCENDMDLTHCNIVTHVLFLTVSISR